MAVNKIFCEEKFKTMLGASTVGMVIPILTMIANAVIVGNILGEKALSAMNVFTPLLTFFIGLSDIVSIGACYIYSFKIGQAKKQEANQIFGEGLIISLFLSVFAYILSNLSINTYLSFLGTSPEITQYTLECFRYYQYVIALYPIYFLLSDLVLTDGDEFCTYLSNIILLIGNIGISIIACCKMGIAGVGLGAFIGTAGATLALGIHFFKKSNSLRPELFFSLKSVAELIKFSIIDAGLYLYIGIQTFILDKFVIQEFGDFYLPVLTLVINVIQITIIFDGIGQAMTPLVNVYLGEKNNSGVRKVMKIATRTAIIEGLFAALLLFAFSSLIPLAFDITSSELQQCSTTALRIICPTLFCTSLLFLFSSYYLVKQLFKHTMFLCFIKDLAAPITCAMVCRDIWGFNGLWIGLAIAPVFTIIVGFISTKLVFPKKQFPLLLENNEAIIHSFDIILNPENIITVQRKIEEILEQSNASLKTRIQLSLLIEELCMLIMEKNGNQEILSEISVFIDKDVKLIIRDNGVIFDITSENSAMDSFRGYFVKNMMQHQEDKMNLTTTSYNRNFFILPL